MKEILRFRKYIRQRTGGAAENARDVGTAAPVPEPRGGKKVCRDASPALQAPSGGL